MIGHAAKRLGSTATGILRVAQDVVDLLPETIDGELVRCHEVARVVAEVLSVSDRFGDRIVVDGKFGVHDHSWIQIDLNPGLVPYSVGGRGRLILDPYAVGRVPMVQMLDLDATLLPYRRESACDRCGAPNPWLYREGPTRDDVRHEVVAALRSRVSDQRASVYPTWFDTKGGA